MRVISKKRLREFWSKHPQARSPLERFHRIVRLARWRDFSQVRRTFSDADPVKVKSGETVVVFNVGGNNYRVVSKILYKHGIAYILRVLTHEEYNREEWKTQL